MQPDWYRATIPFPSPSLFPEAAPDAVVAATPRGSLEELVECFPLAVVAAFAVAQLDAFAPAFPSAGHEARGNVTELARLVSSRGEVSR